jgi:hypothetical protein
MSSDLVTRIRDALARGWLGEDDVAAIEALEGEIERLTRDYIRSERSYAEKVAADARAERLRAAILWADGQIGEWPERQPGEGAFYWRKELMRRAGLEDDKQ